ncbi:ACP S-malonyltransferase [Streptomyces sp. 8N616]|uniref:ACP S-malonyltransferase n=1 Tax=Streptomyces sp. 8N616 TaxID=3457414 RepID=UPI003FD024F2
MLVLVAPGQGAQAPGFLTPWLDLPGVTERLAEWSAVTELDLVHYGTKADAEEIRDTAVAQPLLVAAGLISAQQLFATPGDVARLAGAAAGHSVGEITAAAATGVLKPEAAMSLVRQRGLAMAKAAAVTETGMSAVLGGDPDAVVAHLEDLGLTPANMNGAGQIVAAGTAEQLAALAENRPEKARVIPLKVAGAFHTRHMAPAVETLEALVPDLAVEDPSTAYVSNKDGEVVATGGEVVQRLVNQVSNPVRWDQCMETFQRLGVTAMIELCPGGTLTGLAKRALPGVKTVALKTPDQLDAARELIATATSAAAAPGASPSDTTAE